MKSLLLAFIPLFVAIDPIGSISLFLGVTQGFGRETKRKLALQAVTTALIVGIVFGIAGRFVFRAIGITTSDFQIAGGILLLVFSIKEIFGSTIRQTASYSSDPLLGIVPLGIPLTAGPATITTILILQDTYPFYLILLALVMVLSISYLTFSFSDRLIEKFGEGFSRVIAKVVAIFLAAIGVMMIRRGIESIFLR